MSELHELKKLWQELYARVTKLKSAAEYSRSIVISPFYGHYGLAGYVITVQGSPPRAMLHYDISGQEMHCLGQSRPVRLPASGAAQSNAAFDKERLFRTTIELLEAANCSVETGGESPPNILYISNTSDGAAATLRTGTSRCD